MELVYLWVEDYKNIHKQGFNFSPRFNCEYDEEKNELTIDENNKHIENFFGDNINVTTIVGKNGSGKSSVLELIEKHYDSKYLKNKKFLFVTKIENIYYCIYSLTTKPKDKTNIEISYVPQYDTLNNLESDHPYIHVDWVAYNGLTEDNIYSNMSTSLTHAIFHRMKTPSIDIRFFLPKYVTLYKSNKEYIDKLKQIYSFDTIKIKLRKRMISELNWLKDTSVIIEDENVDRKPFRKNRKIIEEIIDLVGCAQEYLCGVHQVSSTLYSNPTIDLDILPIHSQFVIDILIGFVELFMKKSQKLSMNILLKDVLKRHANRIKQSTGLLITKDDVLNIINDIKSNDKVDFFEENEITLESYVEAINFFYRHLNTFEVDEKDGYCMYIKIEEIEDSTFQHLERLYNMFDDNDKSFVDKENSFRILELDLIESKTGVHYQGISSGERQFLNYIIDLLIQINHNIVPPQNNIILLGDEIDNSLHPVWKKQLITKTLNVIDVVNCSNIHFIFTTHSPFLLSDIPKQNIIFLDTYKKDDDEVKKEQQKVGNCRVLRHDEVLEKKQTFGANIHTLLSDSFFMEDGLMGEFANERIESVIKLLKSKRKLSQKNKKLCEDTISIIGEPFLKSKLEKMYEAKFPKTQEEKIAELKAEIERLENGSDKT